MDIKILDSHLREHLETKATPQDIAKALSLSTASVEKIEPFEEKDFIYNIEITTNRVDMASVMGIAREAAAVLPHFGFDAKTKPLKLIQPTIQTDNKETIAIQNDATLVRRICAVILEVNQKESPQYIKDRLEAAGIRSLNNLIDITNYVMLEIGHPTHVFDYDRLSTKKLIIRQSKKGETITTLDDKTYHLEGGDIVADNGEGEIVDLLGVMGLLNSVVIHDTKRILFFLDNNDPWKIRQTSMGLGLRTQAAQLNEKDIDANLTMLALQRGVQLYQEFADAKIISDVIDIYPVKPKLQKIIISNEKIQKVIGVEISLQQSIAILSSLGFDVKTESSTLKVLVPSWRDKDVTIPEDIVEEVARVYGYYNIPNKLPPFETTLPYHMTTNPFYWEKRIKQALKYWGFTEVYTYSMVSENLLEGPPEQAVTLANPLDQEHAYMRLTLTPSLLEVVKENKSREDLRIFEIANVYQKRATDLPLEVRMLAGIMKGKLGDFYHVKGVLEQLTKDAGLSELLFQDLHRGGLGADIYIGKDHLAEIEVLEENLVAFELNFDLLCKHATLKKVYTPLPKYPPIIEDVSLLINSKIKTGDLMDEIKKQSELIVAVSLLDEYQDTKTFHIIYQDKNKNLTTEEIATLREKILSKLKEKFDITQK